MLSHVGFAQETDFSIQQIDSIVAGIDLSCVSGGITDFKVESRTKGSRKVIHGGGADWYYTDSAGRKLLKAVREVSLESESLDSYYFYRDSLIYLRSTNAGYRGDQRIINWSRQCYFQKGKLLLKQDNLRIPFDPKNYLKTAHEFFSGQPIWKK